MRQVLALICMVGLSAFAIPALAAERTVRPVFRPSPNRVSMPLTDVSAAMAVVRRTDVPASDSEPGRAAMVRAASSPVSAVPLRTPLQTMHPLPTSAVTPLGFRRADFAYSHDPQPDGRTGLSRTAHDASAGISTRVIK